MPVWSGVYENLSNGNLGILPTSPVGTIVAVGPCQTGVVGDIYLYGPADKGAILGELGYGDLPMRLLNFFELAGQNAKAIVVPADPDVAGAISDVIQGTGSGSAPAATTSGSPVGAFRISVEILTGGAHGTATFRWSPDGGTTWYGPIATPAIATPYALSPTGVSVAFASGTFLAGDTYDFDTEGPGCTASSLLDALDIAKDSLLPFEYAVVMTPTVAATWSSLDTWAEGLFDEHNPIRVLTEAELPDFGETAADFVTARAAEIASFASDRVSICVGTVEVSGSDGKTWVVGLSGLVAGLIAGFPVQRSVGSTRYGRLSPVTKFVPAMTEAQIKTLDEARYVVARRYVGLVGFYVNNGNIASESISDYQAIEVGRVMDNVIRNLRVTALGYVHSEVLVVNGVADPSGLKALEGACQGTLRNLAATFSSARIEIPAGQDVIATSQIDATITVVPLGYAKKINLTFGLAKV